jgi:hypothetical protein
MSETVFEKVWYLDKPNEWGDLKFKAFRDIGRLVLTDGYVDFIGRKEGIHITNIHNVSYSKQGRDFINNWVKIEYDGGRTAYFADGSMLGWGGILGGTLKIFNAVRQCQNHLR